MLYFYLLHIFLLLFATYIMYATYLLHIASFISCIQLAIVPLKIMLFICYIYFFIYFFFIYFFFDLLHIFVHKMEWKIPFWTLYHVWMNLCSIPLNESRTAVKVFVKRLIPKLSPGNIMASRFNRQNFMQQWATTLYSRDKIDLIHYCQGQALISVQKLCWNCQRFMHLERDRTSQDGWRWYERFCTCISFTSCRLRRRTVIITLLYLLFWKWNYFWFIFYQSGVFFCR